MRKDERRGRLIVFEGTDGTGKSTQLKKLHDHLVKLGLPVSATREPTNGKYGRLIRELYHNRAGYSKGEELELFLADRREHVEQLLVPALERGRIILCDRYFLSTAAYQGATGFDPEEILLLNRFAPDPDIALLFRMDLDRALQRIVGLRGDALNDFEKLQDLKRVADIFLSIRRDYITAIDASGNEENVFNQVLQAVSPLLEGFSPGRV
jgi:dTMP kinase